MRCLALLSGGKDSVAAVEVAQGHGFDVVCALILRPAQDDAWMFHTPNLDAATGVAECLGLPVEVAAVRAGKKEEVADLEAAIRPLVGKYRLDAVMSGALASDYQKVRIDDVGHRLGIKTFAPLWHKEPRAYVRGLLAGGYVIHFSRTAADGVDNAWAGQRMTSAHVEAMEKHQARPNVAGEGGEYETIVLDAPHFKQRMEVRKARVESSASRATWVLEEWSTSPKMVLHS